MDREKVIADIEEQIAWIQDNDFHKFPGWGHAVLAMKDALALLKEQPEIVRCKDCKHRPIQPEPGKTGFALVFPDSNCPCQCDDGWYSWYPPDDWFCHRGERT